MIRQAALLIILFALLALMLYGISRWSRTRQNMHGYQQRSACLHAGRLTISGSLLGFLLWHETGGFFYSGIILAIGLSLVMIGNFGTVKPMESPLTSE